MTVVTIAFRDKGGAQAYINLPWVSGQRLRHYLRAPALRQYNLIGLSMRSRLLKQDRTRVKLTYTLAPGDTVHVIPVRKPG